MDTISVSARDFSLLLATIAVSAISASYGMYCVIGRVLKRKPASRFVYIYIFVCSIIFAGVVILNKVDAIPRGSVAAALMAGMAAGAFCGGLLGLLSLPFVNSDGIETKQ